MTQIKPKKVEVLDKVPSMLPDFILQFEYLRAYSPCRESVVRMAKEGRRKKKGQGKRKIAYYSPRKAAKFINLIKHTYL